MKLIITNQSSIFSIINNHLNENETKTNKTALKYTTKKEKTPTFGWSYVDDADDTDHPDRSVTDTDRHGHGHIIEFWSPSTQKALKGKNETKTNKTAFKYTTKKQKTPTFLMIARRWCRWYKMIQIFQMNPIIANQSSIFSIICNHLNKTKQKPTKQL